MKRKVSVGKKRKLVTYAEMWYASHCLLKKGQIEERGRYWQFMASLAFTAFTLEAYLNHLGPKLFDCWDDALEGLPPVKKLHFIAEHLKIKPDFSRRPYQTIRRLFSFRNDIAHGKSRELQSNEELHVTSEQLNKALDEGLEARWEAYCNEDNAMRAREDVEKITTMLHKKAGVTDDVLFHMGMSTTWTSLLPE